MKLEKGMYVRYKEDGYTKINKVTDFFKDSMEYDRLTIFLDKSGIITEFDVIREPSHNIIDLIEVGDYVNDEKVIYIDDLDGALRQYHVEGEDIDKDVGHYYEEIKSIVTKEQFENMSYKVGE